MYDTIKRSSRIGLERRVIIDEVNPASSIIQGKDAYGHLFQVTFDFHDPLVAIPQQGELWTIIQYDSRWRLDRKIESGTETTPVTELQPGDRRISTTGDVHIDATTTNLNSDTNVTGNISSSGDANITGNANIDGDVNVGGDTTVVGNVNVDTNLYVQGNNILDLITSSLTNAIVIAPSTSTRNVIQPTGAVIPLTIKDSGGNQLIQFGTTAKITFGTNSYITIYDSNTLTIANGTGTPGLVFTGSGYLKTHVDGSTGVQIGPDSIQLLGTGNTQGITLGGDTLVYRSGASSLKTDGALVAGSSVTAGTSVIAATDVQGAILEMNHTTTADQIIDAGFSSVVSKIFEIGTGFYFEIGLASELDII